MFNGFSDKIVVGRIIYVCKQNTQWPRTKYISTFRVEEKIGMNTNEHQNKTVNELRNFLQYFPLFENSRNVSAFFKYTAMTYKGQ